VTQSLQHYDSQPTETYDRRVGTRIVTVCRLVKVHTSTGEGIARCRNISNGGVSIETHMPVRPRDRVTISFSPDVEVEGRFAWIDGSEIGVAFDTPVDCVALLRETAPSKPRMRSPRLQTALPASVSFPGGQCGALVSNISLQGMKVSHDGQFHPGLNVTVMLADGRERRAMVCWTRDDAAGLQLLDRFRLEELPPLLATGEDGLIDPS
jgi:hypothetical protein